MSFQSPESGDSSLPSNGEFDVVEASRSGLPMAGDFNTGCTPHGDLFPIFVGRHTLRYGVEGEGEDKGEGEGGSTIIPVTPDLSVVLRGLVAARFAGRGLNGAQLVKLAGGGIPTGRHAGAFVASALAPLRAKERVLGVPGLIVSNTSSKPRGDLTSYGLNPAAVFKDEPGRPSDDHGFVVRDWRELTLGFIDKPQPKKEKETPIIGSSSYTANWRSKAVCPSEDPELFFPVGTSGPALLQIAEAKTVCRRCPVTTECLTWSLKSGQDDGVWGGTSENERRDLKRRDALTLSEVPKSNS